MICILFQRGSTSLGFQIGRVELSLVYPRYWGKFKIRRWPSTKLVQYPRVFRFRVWPKGEG